jgi:hypothetical protein
MDKQQDAEKYIKEAVRHLDGMTERERYRTRGLFYYLTSDYPSCVKEVQRPDCAVRRGRSGTKQPRSLPDALAAAAESGRGNA